MNANDFARDTVDLEMRQSPAVSSGHAPDNAIFRGERSRLQGHFWVPNSLILLIVESEMH